MDIDTLASPTRVSDTFTHVRIIIGMVLGMALSKLLTGLTLLIKRPARNAGYLIHLGWTAYAFLAVAQFWWFEFNLRHIDTWSFGLYLFLIFYTALYFLLCTLLFPDSGSASRTRGDLFMSRRRGFFPVLICLTLADGVDTLLKGRDYFEAYGPEYVLQLACIVTLSGIALRTNRLWFHAAFVCASLAAQLAFAIRHFLVL